MNYGKAIKRLRNQQDMTARELASRLHSSPATISLIETGKKEPSLKMLTLIGKVLNRPLSDIILRAETIDKGEG